MLKQGATLILQKYTMTEGYPLITLEWPLPTRRGGEGSEPVVQIFNDVGTTGHR